MTDKPNYIKSLFLKQTIRDKPPGKDGPGDQKSQPSIRKAKTEVKKDVASKKPSTPKAEEKKVVSAPAKPNEDKKEKVEPEKPAEAKKND